MGYTQRFGLVHVDHETVDDETLDDETLDDETLARTPERSFEWYAATIAAQPGR